MADSTDNREFNALRMKREKLLSTLLLEGIPPDVVTKVWKSIQVNCLIGLDQTIALIEIGNEMTLDPEITKDPVRAKEFHVFSRVRAVCESIPEFRRQFQSLESEEKRIAIKAVIVELLENEQALRKLQDKLEVQAAQSRGAGSCFKGSFELECEVSKAAWELFKRDLPNKIAQRRASEVGPEACCIAKDDVKAIDQG